MGVSGGVSVEPYDEADDKDDTLSSEAREEMEDTDAMREILALVRIVFG